MSIAKTPEPPYYAVVFTSIRTEDDDAGYAATADAMVEMASKQPGYLGVESARGEDRLGITVSYWASLEAIRAWRAVAEHAEAQRMGREKWYRSYTLRIAKVEREYGFERS